MIADLWKLRFSDLASGKKNRVLKLETNDFFSLETSLGGWFLFDGMETDSKHSTNNLCGNRNHCLIELLTQLLNTHPDPFVPACAVPRGLPVPQHTSLLCTEGETGKASGLLDKAAQGRAT